MGFCKIDGPNLVLTGLRFVAVPQPQVETWGYYKFVPPKGTFGNGNYTGVFDPFYIGQPILIRF